MPRRHSPIKHHRYHSDVNTTCQSKQRYRDQNQATAAIEQRLLQTPQIALDSYHCPYCHHWHLTSRQSSDDS